MAGFRKAKAEQAALKIGLYGPPGSGKSFTSLLIAEGLAKQSGKRVAVIDTEHGTDFYCQTTTRKVHPEAFDFDALYTRSITEVVLAVRSLSAAEYACIVVDSITHLWESCIAAYGGNKTRAGTIPMHAWGKIKAPYKELMAVLLSSPCHVLICGRQGTEYAEDDATGELKTVGLKMKAEGETPHEPHILLRMEGIRPAHGRQAWTVRAIVEKDRTGVLAGQVIDDPTFDTIAAPLLGLLGGSQAQIPNADDTAAADADRLAEADSRKQRESQAALDRWMARIKLAESAEQLKAIGKELTPAVKAAMTTEHVTSLREAYLEREAMMR